MPRRRARNEVSKRLVIDATVACAAGGEDAVRPTSKYCRDFLLDVRDICHHVVLTPEIREEWKRHRSSFTHKWHVSMFAKKKVHTVTTQQNDQLRNRIAKAIQNTIPREAARKDVHLIEAALAGDRIVVSLDEKAREAFSTASRDVRTLTEIVWANPSEPSEDVPAWLRAGAPDDSHRKLGAK